MKSITHHANSAFKQIGQTRLYVYASWPTALCVVAICVLCGCRNEASSTKKTTNTNQQSIEAILCSIQRGASLESVSKTLGIESRHEFQVNRGGAEILCVSYGVEQVYARIYLVFENGSLEKIVEPPPFNYHTVPYRGTSKKSVRSSWSTEDRVTKVLNLNDLSPEECIGSIDRRRPRQSVGAGQRVAFLLGGGYSQEWQSALESDRAASERKDAFMNPFRFKPGTPISTAIEALGQPSCTTETKVGDYLIRVFQPPGRGVGLDAHYAPSPVTVVSRDETIHAVYSHDFYNLDDCDEAASREKTVVEEEPTEDLNPE